MLAPRELPAKAYKDEEKEGKKGEKEWIYGILLLIGLEFCQDFFKYSGVCQVRPSLTISDVFLMLAPRELPPKAYKYDENEGKKGKK